MQLVPNPQWYHKDTHFQLCIPPLEALDQILNILNSSHIDFEISKKKYRLKARFIQFVDFCDFSLRIYEGNMVELQFENGCKRLFFEVVHIIMDHFHPIKTLRTHLLFSEWKLDNTLTQQEKLAHWNQTISNIEECKLLDMQYQCYQGLILIAYQLPLDTILHLIDLDKLIVLLHIMIDSKELEIIRFGVMLLTILLKRIENHVLLSCFYQKLQTLSVELVSYKYRSKHLLQEIGLLLDCFAIV